MERSIVTLGMLIRRASSAPAGIEFKLGVSQIVLKVEVASAGLLSLVVEEDVNAAVVRLRCSLVVAQSDCRSRRDAA